MPKKEHMTIVIDTREQDPYSFGKVKRAKLEFDTIRATLKTGDYSIQTDLITKDKDKITLERKSLADLFGSMGRGRERLENEFVRMADFGYAAIIIEADIPQIMNPHGGEKKFHSKLNPRSVISTLWAWSQRYGVHIHTLPNRGIAELVTFRLLERWQEDTVSGKRREIWEPIGNTNGKHWEN